MQTHIDLRTYRGDIFRIAPSKTASGWLKMARVVDGEPSNAELMPPTADGAFAIDRTLRARGCILTPRSVRELRAFVEITFAS